MCSVLVLKMVSNVQYDKIAYDVICVSGAVISSTAIFVSITNNTLYGSKLYIYAKIMLD